MRRRDFLQGAAALSSGLFLNGSSWARSVKNTSNQDAPKLLFVLLRGGCDADSVVFQHQNSFYYDSRPNIAIGRSGLEEERFRLDDMWGLSPALSPLLPLLERKQLAFIPFSGTGDNSRSHFLAQELLEAGLMPGQLLGQQSGLLNRILQAYQAGFGKDQIGGTNFGRANTVICKGSVDMPNLNLQATKGALSRFEEKAEELAALYREAGYADRLASVAQRNAMLRQQGMDSKAHGASFDNDNFLIRQFRQMANLMKGGGGFSVSFFEVGGWDTHVGQGGDIGPLASKLRGLADGLMAYVTEMGAAWGQTQVVVMSEFGRTFQENGNKGTDHGHGGVTWLLSGKPYRSSILGEQIRLSDKTLHEGRDWPVLNDYLSILEGHVLRPAGLEEPLIKKALRSA